MCASSHGTNFTAVRARARLRDARSLAAVVTRNPNARDTALRAVVRGFVSLESAGRFGPPLDLDESFHRLVRASADGLRPKQ